MEDSKGCCACLSAVSATLGIVASLVTIFAYFNIEADSLLQSVGNMIPVAAELLNSIDESAREFTARWPLGPALSAIVLCILIVVFRIIAEFVFDLLTTEVELSDVIVQLLVYLPLALAWLWLFSGVVSTLGIVLFFTAYIVSIVGSIILASVLSDI